MQQHALTINEKRMDHRIAQLAAIGKISETGVCRLALSPEDREAAELVKGWMEEAGMAVRIDAFGNLIGRIEGEDADAPSLMLGSHIDTQPYAGRFDGIIGVLGAIEVVQTFAERGLVPAVPVEAAAFCDEEGCRFNKGLFGSRGLIGRLEAGELERADKNGVTRREALLAFGGDPERFAESQYPPGRVGAFLELHIEQGPVLESLGRPVGIVTGISGPLWWTVDLYGFAGHAGSVPMPMRRDALAGAARIIVGLQELASGEPGAPTVGTVGSLRVFPDSRNIIPEQVQFTVDLRDIDLARRDALEAKLRALIVSAAEANGLTAEIREDTNSEPRYCAETIVETIRGAAKEMSLDVPELMSGPFHDALAMSYYCDYGMIFVRCKEGISHNPKEYSSPEDIALGTELLYRTALKLCGASSSATDSKAAPLSFQAGGGQQDGP
ncbi:M20 family metallo-hydrolase [Paenibacillus sacheonensis]|uniref:Hydantoinase/carbamoylase family amidase n=1 Tax=Paenibacillus sacheonensis TaxID=742054 RepID=A0A7X4YUI2_9BACL|nr:M20 family metallo-hydrolase [Paenibacillus sacheonensis]MBM7568191.1 allantoate deiminase/N-carbamoyl-L-amino-acid hydrolase [Paenibacillus sacheonensis]NBC71811.1 hydantoinase/carbamoylase family amidase [Paenibacillus sacheonensis]